MAPRSRSTGPTPGLRSGLRGVAGFTRALGEHVRLGRGLSVDAVLQLAKATDVWIVEISGGPKTRADKCARCGRKLLRPVWVGGAPYGSTCVRRLGVDR